jgi:hypothetical protein
MEKFDKKSYFYHKTNGLPPAELDDDSDSADEDKARAYGFEEPEEGEEEDNVVGCAGMDIDTDEM